MHDDCCAFEDLCYIPAAEYPAGAHEVILCLGVCQQEQYSSAGSISTFRILQTYYRSKYFCVESNESHHNRGLYLRFDVSYISSESSTSLRSICENYTRLMYVHESMVDCQRHGCAYHMPIKGTDQTGKTSDSLWAELLGRIPHLLQLQRKGWL